MPITNTQNGIKATIDTAAVQEVRNLLGDLKDKYKSVLVTSINKTLKTAQTQSVARIGNKLNLKSSRIKQDFTMQKASYSDISGALIASGEPVGLVQFGANQTQKGTSVKVLRSSPRTLLKHAFIATGKGNTKEHVFWRSTPRSQIPAPKRYPVGKIHRAPWGRMSKDIRTPLERLTGPRIEDIFAQDEIMEPITIQAQHVYLKNVESKIEEVIRRYG